MRKDKNKATEKILRKATEKTREKVKANETNEKTPDTIFMTIEGSREKAKEEARLLKVRSKVGTN